jgi:hypothetical protein
MGFIDQNRVNASLALQSGHYTFPRAAKLRDACETACTITMSKPRLAGI